jgi:transcriptional regulator with XRE-family HTH domain
MNIGEKIKKLRVEKMMTQAELSGAQMTRNMLSLIEKGKAVPSLQNLVYIASRLNVTPAFLLADESEEQRLLKYSRISDIRLAYKNKNYRICLDMCKRLGRSKDDEIKLIMSECALEVAKELIFSDRIRDAWEYIDEAVLYSSETAYCTKHITAAAGVLFDYLGQLSPSLMSENMDMESFDISRAVPYCADDELLCYIAALVDGRGADRLENEAYRCHVECRALMRNGSYEKANSLLVGILKLDIRLPGVFLYHVFSDLEECSRTLGNQKVASAYSLEKVTGLERILS